MSESPWNAHGLFFQLQDDIAARPELRGGMLSLDDSGEERAGGHSAGASRQYIGRLGKVEMGQVTVALSYSLGSSWLMVDAEPYLAQEWFDQKHRAQWRRLGIPEETCFATKLQLGLKMVRIASQTLPFEVIGCDSAYGRDGNFRAELGELGKPYMADVPSSTRVFLRDPSANPNEQSVEVAEVPTLTTMRLRPVTARHSERGPLTYACAARRIWTRTSKTGQVREEWLFVRRESQGDLTYSLSNAAAKTGISTLARWRCERYFIERTFQDSKSELGWDELVARKYPAWMHHTALTALALWYIVRTKLNWAKDHPPGSELAKELEVEVLPALSVANVREMLRAAMPLDRLSIEDSLRLVAKHLVNRARSTAVRSRTKPRRYRRQRQSRNRTP